MTFRLATSADVPALSAIEEEAFPGDRLTPRRFRHFIRSSHSELWVHEDEKGLQAYILVLFHRGTSLARLYSIAVAAMARGRGLARQLLDHAESQAMLRGVFFMRLEVRDDNEGALYLYEYTGHRRIRFLPGYYEDGSAGWRLEKHLSTMRVVPQELPFYGQTTPFTCGPSALMMAMRSLQSEF